MGEIRMAILCCVCSLNSHYLIVIIKINYDHLDSVNI